jgi:hypothetical protein
MDKTEVEATSKKEVRPLTAKISQTTNNGTVRVEFSKFIEIPDLFQNLTHRNLDGNYTEVIN